MNFERMQISPTRAKELLQKNPMNRKLDQNVVEQYAEAMRKGDWHEESPEPIAFDPNGTLAFNLYPSNTIVHGSPWHTALLVKADGSMETVKRKVAEETGYDLIWKDSRPYYFLQS